MRTLKYAILGLLRRGSMTGYDIAKAFEKGLGNFWNASHSQIYPEMRKLLVEGLVECSTVIQGEKLEKKLYTITDAGARDFQQWILLDEPLDPTHKDTFRLRVYLSDSISDGELLDQLQSQLGKRKQKLNMLEEFLADFEPSDYADMNKIQRGDYLVLRGAIMREQGYVNWLLWSIEMVEQHA